jgi:predicted nucleic acid-binding protein
VTRYLLDTNIVSDAVRPRPLPAVTDWLGAQLDSDLFISVLTVAEVSRGILEKKPGRKRTELERWFAGPDGPQALFRGRVLPFDERSAAEWAKLMAQGTAVGRPRSALDMVIAATAAANRCVVVTLNGRHFEGVVDLLDLRRPAT